MTQTVQALSLAYSDKEGKDLNIDESEAEDNISLLIRLFDSLNTLCEQLSRLAYLLQRKNIEQIIHHKEKGEVVSVLQSRLINNAAHAVKKEEASPHCRAIQFTSPLTRLNKRIYR
jgi:hypothetical protein